MKESINILIIEDDAVFVEMIREILSKNQNPAAYLEHRNSLSKGLDYLTENRPDIILLDLGLPDSQGIESFLNIHQRSPSIPIVVMTALDDDEVALNSVRQGAQDYLVKKDVDSNLLIRSILYALERHQLQEALQKAYDEMEQRVEERTASLSAVNLKLTQEIGMREQAEEAAKKAYTELNQIFNTAVAHCVIDNRCNVLRINNEFSRLFQLEEDQLVGKKCSAVWHCASCHTPGCPLEKILQGEKPDEFEIKRRIGDEEIWCSITPAAYLDAQGELIGMVATVINITDRKKAEEQAKLNQEQLIQADKMASLGILVSGVAHEINNPNSFITLNASVFKRVWDNLLSILEDYYQKYGDFHIGSLSFPEIRQMVPELIEGMTEGARRINRIVKNLKDFARKESADMNEDVDINSVVSSALTLLNNIITKTSENFSVQYGENIPRFKGNSQQIEQVVVNIVINSCQAIEDKNQGIFVSTAYDAESKRLALTIRDEGRGMSESMQKKIFDPFFTTKRNIDGTGLGLSISSNIIQAHKGTIAVESTPGKGTTFTITLPAGD